MSEMNTPNPALAERLWQRHTLGQKLARTAFWLGIGIAVLLSLRNINVIWEFLWDAPEQMLDMVRRMFPPDYAYYRVAVHTALMETFHIATLGTIFALIAALPLSILAAHNLTPNRGLNFLAKTLLVASRSVNSLVWALLFGVLLRNFLTSAFKVNMFDRAIDVFGNASLSIFLGIALLNLKLWQLLDLALPMLIILAVQTAIMALYAYFVTYRFMGKDYDAAVLSAGHCGFGLGATPTAVANMQSVTERFGPSHKAFLIVPMVGAFFIDFVNAFILTGFVNFLGK